MNSCTMNLLFILLYSIQSAITICFKFSSLYIFGMMPGSHSHYAFGPVTCLLQFKTRNCGESCADPRLELTINDARVEVQNREEKYDVIIGDLANPIEGGPHVMNSTPNLFMNLLSSLNSTRKLASDRHLT